MTHYDVLGVTPAADHDEIHRAFVRLARRHHPDVLAAAGAGERAAAEVRMRAITEAWSVLGDPARRHAYDRALGVGASASNPDPDVFRPFEDDLDGEAWLDPDQPYRSEEGESSPLRRAATLAPILLFAVAVAVFVLGLMMGAGPLIALAVGLLALSCVGFLVLPLVEMSRAVRDER